eukprot:7184707-Prymnesium_polylepis.1
MEADDCKPRGRAPRDAPPNALSSPPGGKGIWRNLGATGYSLANPGDASWQAAAHHGMRCCCPPPRLSAATGGRGCCFPDAATG